MEAFAEHGSVDLTLEQGLSDARAQIVAIEALGIKMDQITAQLEDEGVSKFADSYEQLLSVIRKQAVQISKELGPITEAVQSACLVMDDDQVLSRLWKGEASLWTQNPEEAAEVKQRMGWLTLPEDMQAESEPIQELAQRISAEGIKQIVLLGMGGSSLAPDVFRRIFAEGSKMTFLVLDSTDPVYIRSVARKAPIRSSLFIVSSKSGTTVETRKLMDYFWHKAGNSVGQDAGHHFVAITDSGSELDNLARERGFRQIFNPDPQVGGRYSVLSHFGMVPAGILGLDVHGFLQGGHLMAGQCKPNRDVVRNPGAYLGAVLGSAATAGRDKLTLIADDPLDPLVDWIEQLIAESTGKDGQGLLPVVDEPVGAGKAYPQDRLLIYLRSEGQYDRRMSGWVKAGVPFVVLDLQPAEQSLGAAFFQWEMATAVACHLLQINAFNQPNVQQAKQSAAELLETFNQQGRLPRPTQVWSGKGIRLVSQSDDLGFEAGLDDVAQSLVGQLTPESPLVMLGYLNPNRGFEAALNRLRRAVRDDLGRVVTFGYGPRYLHSTGQYHKGGPTRGVFILLTRDVDKDEPIPDETASFGILEMAQALGDLQALHQAGQKAYLFQLEEAGRVGDVLEALTQAAHKLGG
jgi:glucose-6-phosphate isomerase